jgi:hypothetical protein
MRQGSIGCKTWRAMVAAGVTLLLLSLLPGCGGAGEGGSGFTPVIQIGDFEIPVDKTLVLVSTKRTQGLNTLSALNETQLGCESYEPFVTHIVTYFSYAARDTVLVDAAILPQNLDAFNTAIFAPEGEALMYVILLERRSAGSNVVLSAMRLPGAVEFEGGTVKEIELDLNLLQPITLEWLAEDGRRRPWSEGPYEYSTNRVIPTDAEYPHVGIQKVVNLPWMLDDPRGPDGGWENMAMAFTPNALLPILSDKTTSARSAYQVNNLSPWSYGTTYTVRGSGFGFNGASLAFPGLHFITADAVCTPQHTLTVPPPPS